MTPEQLFEQLQTHIEQHSGTMTQQDVQMWSNKIYSLKRQTDSMLEDFSLREIAFLQFFASDPTSLTLSFEYESQYDDEGGYYNNFANVSIDGYSHPPLASMLNQWGYNFTSEMDNPDWIDLGKRNTAFVGSLEHPLLALFGGYEPSDTAAWGNLWTMMRSTDMANFNQACALLEGLLEGDEDLRNSLIANTECDDVDVLLSFHCNRWWMVLFLDEPIYNSADGTFDGAGLFDILADEGNTSWDFTMGYTDPPTQITQTIMNRVNAWIERANQLSPTEE